MAELIYKPGEVRIENLAITNAKTGDTLDLTNFAAEINIYEDIFSPVIFGNIIISDAVNAINTFPILGTEVINLRLRTPQLGTAIEGDFQLYAIEDRQLLTDREQSYRLAFISREGYRDQVTNISKTFRGKTHEIAAEIFSEYVQLDKDLIIGDTPHQSKITYTSNFWTAFRNFNFLSKRSKGADLGANDFLFFETNSSFWWASTEWLIDEQLKNGLFEEYIYEPPGVELPRRVSGYNFVGAVLPPEFTQVEDIKIPKTMDLLEQQDSGFYSNGVRAFNFTTGEHFEKNFNAIEEWEKYVRTDKGSIIPALVEKMPYSNVQFIPLNSWVHNDYEFDDEYLENPSQRQTYSNSFKQFKFQMEVPGRTDIEVGKLIVVMFPNVKSKTIDDPQTMDMAFDELLTGPYLVTAINHKIDNAKHYMILEIVKNGLTKSIGD
jgi:hypothetical protein